MTSATLNNSAATAQHRATGLLVSAAALIALPVLVVAAVVGLLTGLLLVLVPVGVAVGLAAAAALIVPARQHAEERALQLLDVRAADPEVHARLFNLVDGLCAAAGVPRPRLYVLDRPAANALSFGRDARHGCLVVTEGLLASLNRIELEGVVAHELAHLRCGDTAVPTTALSICGPLAAGALEGIAVRLVARAAPSGREGAADLAGVSLTRYPPGLLAALQRIRDGDVALAGVPPATLPLWLAPVGAVVGRDVLAERIEALQEL